MLRTDTISKTGTIDNGETLIIDATITPETPATITSFFLSQEKAVGNITSLFSGDTLIYSLDNGLQSPFVEVNFVATGTIKIVKTGADDGFFIVNYVKSDLTGFYGFTQGEALTGLFLFLLILGGVFSFSVKRFIMKI